MVYIYIGFVFSFIKITLVTDDYNNNLLTKYTSVYNRRQFNWFTLSLFWISDQNGHSAKPTVYHNLEQVYEPRFEPVTNDN